LSLYVSCLSDRLLPIRSVWILHSATRYPS